jgi:trigger factor
MQITETSTAGLKREYKVTVEAADIAARVDTRLKSIAKSLKLPGFRPGKVPVSLVKQRYGGSIVGEVLEETVKESSSAALAERNLRPALQPTVTIESFEEGNDLVYAMALEILPDIEPFDYTGIALERLKPDVAETEIDQAIQRLAERTRKAEPAPEGTAAETGDIAVIDSVGSIDGVEFPGGTLKDYQLELGSSRLIPGFEDQVIGARAGDKIDVKVTFPSDYGAEELRDKAAVFATEVKEIRRKLPAVIGDSLAEDLGMENLVELRQTVREQIEREYGTLARQNLKRKLLDHFAERFAFEVPNGMIDIEFNGIWQQYERERAKETAENAGDTAEVNAADSGKSEDEVKAEYRAIAERRVRLGLLLAEIGRLNDIQVTQDELNRALMNEARQYRGQEKEIIDYYRKNPDAMAYLRAPLYEEKVVDFVLEKANLTDKPISPEELVKLADADAEDEAVAATAASGEQTSASTES